MRLRRSPELTGKRTLCSLLNEELIEIRRMLDTCRPLTENKRKKTRNELGNCEQRRESMLPKILYAEIGKAHVPIRHRIAGSQHRQKS